jgi:hypothetical protein
MIRSQRTRVTIILLKWLSIIATTLNTYDNLLKMAG